MTQKIPCALCAQNAVAELDGEYLCPGCLMRIIVSEDENIPIHGISDKSASQRQSQAGEDARTPVV